MTNSKHSTDLYKEDVTSLTIWKKGTSKGNLFTKKQIKNKNGPSFVQFTYSNSQGTDFSQFKLIAITFSTFHLP